MAKTKSEPIRVFTPTEIAGILVSYLMSFEKTLMVNAGYEEGDKVYADHLEDGNIKVYDKKETRRQKRKMK